MQFGRLHGIALLLLALLLLLAQAWISLSRKPGPTQGDSVPQSQHLPWSSYIPGILGVGCLGLGGFTLIVNRDHPDDVPSHPIK